MTNRIYKYKLSAASGEEVVDLPRSATILCAKAQHDDLLIYCTFDVEREGDSIYRKILKVHTGGHYDPSAVKYIDTVLLDGDNYVLHVFETLNISQPSKAISNG